MVILVKGTSEIEASIIKALRGKGYKVTPQRIAISRFALCSHDHPTAQTIYSKVKKVHPTVSLATVYRTIQTLEEVGLVRELNIPRGQTRFDSDTKPHLNLICLKCGSIKDLDEPTLSELIARVSIAEKFASTGQQFDIYGICQRCEGMRKKAVSKAVTHKKRDRL